MTILNPDMRTIRIFLKAHLKLLSVGMKNSRLKGKHLLNLASRHTGKQYKRGQYVLAIQDLEAMEN